MTVYLTGDIHGEMSIRKLEPLAKQHQSITRDDYMIILGDFGLVWDQLPTYTESYWIDWLNRCPWTTLFIDGNHENFDRLDKFDVDTWHGGKVHYLHDNVIHLMRGQIFDIDGNSFFTMGGGDSIDKMNRTPHKSWWKQEIPNAEERGEAIDNLAAHDNKVDFILTHCPPLGELINLCTAFNAPYSRDMYSTWLQTEIAERVEFDRWFYGHMHVDRPHAKKYIALFDYIYNLDLTWHQIVEDSYPDLFEIEKGQF